MQANRRTFMRAIASATLVGTVGVFPARADAKRKIALGICSSPDKAEKLKAVGFDFIEPSVGKYLKPEISDIKFEPDLARLKSCVLPLRSCNGFLPGKFRLIGPKTTHDEALDYACIACRRADAANIPYIVFGSGAARKVPDGFDVETAKGQFIEFCRKLGKRIEDLKVTIVLEPLNKGETNLLNSVTEGITYVDSINHPRIQLLADFYHMMRENEGPDAIRKAGGRILHCHIAELEGRKAPGTKGEDFSAFFKALQDINYTGGVSCECRWPKDNLEDAWKKAVATMRNCLV